MAPLVRKWVAPLGCQSTLTKNGTVFGYKFGKLWKDTNESALSFVKELEIKFKRKTKTYGFLKVDKKDNSVPSILTRFNDSNGKNFRIETEKLMERIEEELNSDSKRGNTQVGHVVIVHYCTEADMEDKGKLLLVMVDKKDVFDFGDGLVPEKFKSIDVDTLRQAVMYDLTLFEAIYPDHVAENHKDSYLRFISGKSSGQFFRDALGTSDIIENTVSLNSVFDAVEKYAENLGLSSAYVDVFQAEVEMLIKSKKGKQVSLTSIANQIANCLPDNLQDTTSEDFLDFVSRNDFKISQVFDVTPNQLQKVTSIEGGKGSDYHYKVKRSALGDKDEDDKNIRYDKDTRILFIDVLDENEHLELSKALSLKDEDSEGRD